LIEKTVEQLSRMIPISNDISRIGDRLIKGVSINTATLQKGNLFIPLQGEKRDGHEFVEAAFEKGASASLWQKDRPNPPKHLPLLFVDDTLKALQELARKYREELSLKVVAVTGSNGKTTTKDMIAEILAVQYKVQKTIGNLNNHIGLPMTVLELKPDTEVAVLEMGMNHFGEIDFLTRLAKPDVAVITNIGDAHLQELGSREGIAKAKFEIVNGLKEGGLLIIPGEEPLLAERAFAENRHYRVKTFGKSPTNDIYPTSVDLHGKGTIFTFSGWEEPVYLPVLGEYNVYNALAAILVGSEFGVPYSRLNVAFSQLKLSDMRLELLPGINGSMILNDAYNANPTSMKAVLDLFAKLKGYERKIVVLGDMLELGPMEEKFHYEIGESIDAKEIDLVYTYGRLGKFIAEGAKKRFGEERVFSFTDKQALIDHLKANLFANTFVLIKASRGMKLEEVANAISEKTE